MRVRERESYRDRDRYGERDRETVVFHRNDPVAGAMAITWRPYSQCHGYVCHATTGIEMLGALRAMEERWAVALLTSFPQCMHRVSMN